MSALHSCHETGITSPGEDGEAPLVSDRAELVYLIAGLVIAASVFAGRVFGWLA